MSQKRQKLHILGAEKKGKLLRVLAVVQPFHAYTGQYLLQ